MGGSNSYGADGFVENGEQIISIRLIDTHRRCEPDRLSPQAALAQQQSKFAGVLHGLGAFFAAGLLGGLVLDESHTYCMLPSTIMIGCL